MTSVGTALRGKRLQTAADRQSTPFQHRGENGILRQQQLLLMQLQGDMAIAQVICRLQQLQEDATPAPASMLPALPSPPQQSNRTDPPADPRAAAIPHGATAAAPNDRRRWCDGPAAPCALRPLKATAGLLWHCCSAGAAPARPPHPSPAAPLQFNNESVPINQQHFGVHCYRVEGGGGGA